jgi:hypothetical protein
MRDVPEPNGDAAFWTVVLAWIAGKKLSLCPSIGEHRLTEGARKAQQTSTAGGARVSAERKTADLPKRVK